MTKNTRRFEFKMGRTGLTLFVAGISVMLFGVFLLGVTLGKNIDAYPEKIARYLPERFQSLIRPSPDATDPEVAIGGERKPEKPESKLDLTFYKTLGKRKADDKGDAPEGLMLKKAPEERTKERLLTLPAPLPPSIQPKAATPVPAPREAAPAKPERFLVQLVAYQQKSKAEALVKRIAAMGKPARMEATELPDKGKWYRVVMGEFSSRQDAQGAVDAVSKKIKGLNGVIRPIE